MKPEKQKDLKNKEKQDLNKSTQNLVYLISPLGTETGKSFSALSRANEVQKIEVIYQTEYDTAAKKHFLKTPYNLYKIKDSDAISYRSPYSNQFFPPVAQSENMYSSPLVRSIQEKGELLFDQYAKMYYGDCISNFFVEENQDEFSFAYYVQRRFKEEGCQGIWNSTNIATIAGDPTKSITYKVTTSVIYEITCTQDNEQMKPFTLSGNLKRMKNQSKKLTPDIQLDDLHLVSIGKIVEQNQGYLRQQMEEVYARKTKEIIHKIRIPETKQRLEEQKKFMKQLMQSNKTKKQNMIQLPM